MATGDIQFGPGELLSSDQLRVVTKPGGREIPVAILDDTLRWSDGSLISVELSFPISSSDLDTQQYWAELGVKRALVYEREGATAPMVSFAVHSPPAERAPEDTTFAGVLTVHVVGDSPVAYYWYNYWCLAPIIGILGLLMWRKTRLWRSGGFR